MTEVPRTLGPYRVLEAIGPAGPASAPRLFSGVGAAGAGMVMLKVLPPRAVIADPERFEREAAGIAALSHPNVLTLYRAGHEGDTFYLAFEFVNGRTLETVLKERRLSLQEAINVFKGICRGLQHAHARGVLHRDLTPRNVFVSDDLQTVKIADFGLGRTEAGTLTGTIATSEITFSALYYQPPEAMEARAKADVRSDIYSAGVIFHEMLTGRAPGTRFGLPSGSNSEVPSSLDMLVLRCVARNPDDRPPTVAALLAELGTLEEDLRLRLLSEIRDFQTMHLPAQGGGKKLIWVAVVVLVVALAVAAALLLK
jgi:eukaryotic-like serine/threonine-protein kinase